jgi:predicted ATPase
VVSTQYIIELRLRRDAVPSFADYPFCLDAVRDLDTPPLHPAVTFLVGENGSGKSTLLEAVAVAAGFNPEGGSKIIATHSPVIMAYPNAQIFQLGPKGVEPVTYEDTEHFRMTRDCLRNHQQVLEVLLKN